MAGFSNFDALLLIAVDRPDSRQAEGHALRHIHPKEPSQTICGKSPGLGNGLPNQVLTLGLGKQRRPCGAP
jgi:hypothetical protein